MIKNVTIDCGSFKIANDLPITLIAGPCQIESAAHAFECAEFINSLCAKHQMNLIFKSSFDKANRTSINGQRGVGLSQAMQIFADIKAKYNCMVLTDVHNESQCAPAAEVVDVLQIPAFLCRQTDLLLAAGKTNRIINIKKGQFLAPWDMKNVAQKVASTGNNNIMLTERGVSFGYNMLVNDMRALLIMAETGYPVVFDATHSVQEPGGKGNQSGGNRAFVEAVAKAAVAIGVACIFIETHPDPDNAPSDGPCMIPFADLERLLLKIKAFDQLAKSV